LRVSIGVVLGLLASTGNAMGAGRIRFDTQKASQDELKLVSRRLHDAVSVRGASEDVRKRRAAALDPRIDALLASQNRTGGSALYGAFAEVKPENKQDIDFARGYFDPIRTLASAYALPGSRHHRSKHVAEAIRIGFAYTRKHVHPGCPKPGNWWVWAKQMPDCLCDLLALMHGDLQPDDEAYVISILDYLLGTGPIRGSGYHTGKAGKDALNVLKVGVLTADLTRIAHAWECMENEVSPHLLEADGTPLMTVIKSEFLGISLPYIYEGYQTVLEWARLTRGTQLALRPETTGKTSEYLLGLGRWNTFGGTEVGWIGFTSYRVFWRPAQTLSFAARLAETGVQDADRLRAMATGRDSPPTGCRFWPNAETVICRSPKHYCALVMASRPRHPISWSYKNHFLHIGNRWYYGRDGHLVIVRRPADRDPNLTYTLNWRRLTGVTRDGGSLLKSDQMHKEGTGYWQPAYALCRNPIAGAAVLDGRDAVAGIEVHSGRTRARKSTCFLDHMIVTAGSHISGEGQTETIVHTFPIGADKPEILVNGKRTPLAVGKPTPIATPCWIHGPGGGYYFPTEGGVRALVETRQPDFTDHGDPPPDKRPKAPAETFISILFDHGSDPTKAGYACVYFPVAAAGDMPDLAKNFSSRAAQRCDDVGHSLQYGPLAAMAFFRPGALNGYQVDRPCFLVLRKAERSLRLTVYEPSWQECTLRIGLPHKVAAEQLPQNMRASGRDLIIDIKPGRPCAGLVKLAG